MDSRETRTEDNFTFSTMDTPSRPYLFGLLAGLFLAAGIVFAALVVAGAWTRIAESQVINVTGSARKNVTSDLAVWHCQFSVEDPSLLAANEKLKSDLAKVEGFLRAHGVNDYSIAPVQIREVTARGKNEDGETVARRTGYQLTQSIGVQSTEVSRVMLLSRECAQLLSDGVALVSGGIDFLYTKAGETKVEMMAEATKDARARAEQIAGQGGRKIKELRAARMGVIQINPLYSSETSWQGNNDTSSLEKTITATVSATFSLQ